MCCLSNVSGPVKKKTNELVLWFRATVDIFSVAKAGKKDMVSRWWW